MRTDDLSLTLTRKEAAEYCNVSLPSLAAFLKRADNPIPHIKVGRKYVIPADGLREWLAQEAERNGNPVR